MFQAGAGNATDQPVAGTAGPTITERLDQPPLLAVDPIEDRGPGLFSERGSREKPWYKQGVACPRVQD